jgi:hypothetical protein
MTDELTRLEKLKMAVHERMAEDGVLNFHVTAVQGATEEQVYEEMLAILDACDRGECKEWHDY